MAVTRVEVSSGEAVVGETPVVETPAVVAATETPSTPAGTEQTPITPTPETPVTGEQTPVTTDADLDTAATELISAGEITEATLKALESKGFKRGQIETYAAGIQAQAAQAQAKLAERVGGTENMNSMLNWAKTGLPEADRVAYDSMMTSGNEAQMALALDGLSVRYERALGSTHDRITGANAPRDTTVKAFASNAEIVQAMSDPRYARDEAYRQLVAARLAGSNTISIRA